MPGVLPIKIPPHTIKNPLQPCAEGMSKIAAGDSHPRTTRKPSTGFTSAAAWLLLRHGRTAEAANGESIEFFSALRKCLPDPHISGQTAARGAAQPADGKGKTRRGGSGGSADEVLSLSSGIGKHDYDWLLTPPGTPLWSPATSTSGLSAAAPSRLAKAGSASHSKTSSRLGPTGNIGEKKKPTPSRLSNCSSATSLNSNAVPPGRPLRVRTSSVSSINTASNASVSSTPLWSGGSSSPRTPGTARSPAAAATAQTRRRDRARVATTTGYVVVPSMAAPSKPRPTCARAHPNAPGVSSPRSTAATTSRHPSLPRRAGDVATARSRLARQSGGTVSTLPHPRDAHQPSSRGASSVASSSNGGVMSRLTPAASTVMAQRWRRSLAPAIAASRNVRRENSLDNGSPIHGIGQKVNGEKTRPHRAAVMDSGVTRTASLKSTNSTIVKRTVNENEGCRRPDARQHGGAGAPDHRKPMVPPLQETRGSAAVATRSRLGIMAAAASKSGSIAGGHQHGAPVAVVAKFAGPEAFPSTRYDAMLLREDPRNLTWLRGSDEDGGIDLVDSSLELFDVATGLSRSAVRN
ncbi:unnamed protein product [Urochloa decumbens]|uniref:Uncharacterized protein n=1 Tax=Urochloa decumbens TaxID=240449 RepID=A0ABC9GIF0_9POAL